MMTTFSHRHGDADGDQDRGCGEKGEGTRIHDEAVSESFCNEMKKEYISRREGKVQRRRREHRDEDPVVTEVGDRPARPGKSEG